MLLSVCLDLLAQREKALVFGDIKKNCFCSCMQRHSLSSSSVLVFRKEAAPVEAVRLKPSRGERTCSDSTRHVRQEAPLSSERFHLSPLRAKAA